MFRNEIYLKSGLVIPIRTKEAFGMSSVTDGLNIVVNEDNTQSVQFLGEEVQAIFNEEVIEPIAKERPKINLINK